MKNQLMILCSIIFTTAHSMQQYPLIPKPKHLIQRPIDLNKFSEYFKHGTDYANAAKKAIRLPLEFKSVELIRVVLCMLHEPIPYIFVIPRGEQQPCLVSKKEFTEELKNIYEHYYKQFYSYQKNGKTMVNFFPEVATHIARALQDQGHFVTKPQS
jgi:hypothetical protein